MTRQVVVVVLSTWTGAVILVSHDIEFVEKLVSIRVLLMPDGHVGYLSDQWLD